jgi:uncharacterized RDD family membrane protein YckC
MQHFDVLTPEAVDIRYDLAGIGSRFLAQVLDSTIIVCSFILIVLATLGIGVISSGLSSAAVIFLLTATFLLIWGYYLAFEAFWNGQTPGKRVVGIRVVKDSGLPLGFLDSVIRNLVRIIDWLPFFYGIGLLVMFVSPRPRRLGDYAAGTVVIRERVPIGIQEISAEAGSYALASQPFLDEERWRLDSISLDDAASLRRSMATIRSLKSAGVRARKYSELAARLANRIGASSPADPEAFLNRAIALYAGQAIGEQTRQDQHPDGDELAWNLRALTPADTQIVDEFLVRAPSLRPDSRRRLGSEIAGRVAEKIGASPQSDPELFLQRVSVLNQLDLARRSL